MLHIVLSLYKIQILRTSCMMNSMKKNNITLNDFITCLPVTKHLEEGNDNLKVEYFNLSSVLNIDISWRLSVIIICL